VQTRVDRAARARVAIVQQFEEKQCAFLDFVLGHYVDQGVGELDQQKLTPLLRLRYRNSIADAVSELGRPEQIGRMFTEFQKHLYETPRAGSHG
jgi:type I restriction enzyme R subunit